MNAFNPKWEIVAFSGVAIMYARSRLMFAAAPLYVSILHWAFMAIYAAVGISGFRFVLLFCFKRDVFWDLFSQPNVLALGPHLMPCLVLSVSVLEIIFYFVVMELGKLRGWVRSLFNWLVFPCGFFYPILMATGIQNIDTIGNARLITLSGSIGFVVLALGATAFYRSAILNGMYRRD